MTTNYKTLDYLDDLTTDMMAIATPLTFESATKNSSGWDYQAFYFSENGKKYDLFSFQGNENATYDIAAISYMIPDMMSIVDNLGNVLNITTQEFDEDNTYSTSDFGGLMLPDFVAPYTGTYYVGVKFDTLSNHEWTSLVVNEDVNTATNIDEASSFINHQPTGEITISGTAKQDEILTVSSSLADEDGLGDFEYQWLLNGVEILDATAETYTPSVTDIGKTISVKVSYIDGEGTLEAVTSSATAPVTGKSATTGNDLLIGTNGNDKISGLAGNDTLVGGLGKDTLTGDSGADVFKFNASNETGKTSATRDVITDFKHSESDKIDVSGIDANSTSYGDQAFKFIGSKSFSGKAGELRFDSTNKILYGNLNNDKVPDFAIQLNGVKSLVVDDFVL